MEANSRTVFRRHRSPGHFKAIVCDLLIYFGITTVFAVAIIVLWLLSLLIS